jgi:hypothetical protein
MVAINPAFVCLRLRLHYTRIGGPEPPHVGGPRPPCGGLSADLLVGAAPQASLSNRSKTMTSTIMTTTPTISSTLPPKAAPRPLRPRLLRLRPHPNRLHTFRLLLRVPCVL